MTKTEYSNNDIISAIINNQNWAIQEIYNTEFISIKKMVYSFKNTRLEPKDIFHEGLTRTILNIRAGKFRGDSSLATYLNSVCKNICLKILSNPHPVTPVENMESEYEEENNYYELLSFIAAIKQDLGTNCREIIDLRFKQTDETKNGNKLLDFNAIAKKLNITVDNARQRFKRCLDQLREMVFAHPEYQTLFD